MTADFLRCPVCGRSVSMQRFHPEAFAPDIRAQTMKGLGRGRGFAVTGSWSLLETGVPTRLINRLLDVVGLLHDRGFVTDEQLDERFGTTAPEVQEETDTSGEWEQYADGLNMRIRGVVQKIADTLERDLSSEGDTSIDRLEAGADMLVDDYNAFRALSEESE